MLFLYVLDKIISTWKMFLATLAQVALPAVHHDAVTLEAVPRRVLAGVEFLAAEIALEYFWFAVHFQVVLQKEPLIEHRMTLGTLRFDVLLGTRLVVTSRELTVSAATVITNI